MTTLMPVRIPGTVLTPQQLRAKFDAVNEQYFDARLQDVVHVEVPDPPLPRAFGFIDLPARRHSDAEIEQLFADRRWRKAVNAEFIAFVSSQANVLVGPPIVALGSVGRIGDLYCSPMYTVSEGRRILSVHFTQQGWGGRAYRLLGTPL